MRGAPPPSRALMRRAAGRSDEPRAAGDRSRGASEGRPPAVERRGAPRRVSVQSSPSNTRLKLAAPGSWGNLSFVTNQARRRSLSAIR